jgi:hypothetical protein
MLFIILLTFENNLKIDNKLKKVLTFDYYRKVLTTDNNLPLGKNNFFLDFLKISAYVKKQKTHPYRIILAVYRVKVKKNLLLKHEYTPLHRLF